MMWGIDPWRELERVRKQMDEAFTGYGTALGRMVGRSFPLVNVYEGKDDVIVTAELPGFAKENISIKFTDGVLTLSGKKQLSEEAKGWTVIREERASGEFEKAVAVPYKIQRENIHASFKDGVLTVTLPKAEEARPREVTIDVK